MALFYRTIKARPIVGERALLMGDTLAVADLHLGVEHELRENGVAVKSQTGEMQERLIGLLERTGAKRLVIVGDVKHNVPKVSRQEYTHLPRLIDELSRLSDVIVIKGNHDGTIERLLPTTTVLNKLEADGALFLHGHTNLKTKMPSVDCIIMGHNHPCIEFLDEFGRGVREEAWIKTKFNERGLTAFELSSSPAIIILPAFNKLLPGTSFNSDRIPLGPFFSKNLVELNDAEAHLLDGTFLGSISDLKAAKQEGA